MTALKSGLQVEPYDYGPASGRCRARRDRRVVLDKIGLERTAITVIPHEETNPLAEDPATRRAVVAFISHCVECSEPLGAEQLARPLHQTLGHFTGAAPSDLERERAREIRLAAGDYEVARGVRIVLEAIRANWRHIGCVLASENDPGIPGGGHVPWIDTFSPLKSGGYDGWPAIKACSRRSPELVATRIWRDLSASPEAVYRDGFAHIRDGWANA